MTPTNPHFAALAEAQNRRVTQAMRLSDDEIRAAVGNMSSHRALAFIQLLLSETLARSMREAHARPVVKE